MGHCKSLLCGWGLQQKFVAWLGVIAQNGGVVRGHGKSSWHGECQGKVRCMVGASKTYIARFKIVEKSHDKI